MGKAFGLILMVISLYVGITLYTEGMDQAFGGIFASLEPANEREARMGTEITRFSDADAPSAGHRPRRGSITNRVRNRVTADLQEGARRRGY